LRGNRDIAIEATASTRNPSAWYLSSQNMALDIRKLRNLCAPVIKNERLPVGMEALARVRVFEQMSAVEES